MEILPMSLATIHPLTLDTFRDLLPPEGDPCVTIYMPTHHPGPAAAVDPLVYRHLIEGVEKTLLATRGSTEVNRLLGPWRTLEQDHAFWLTAGDGFAGFATERGAWIVPLDGEIEPLGMVGCRFHTLPIVRRLLSVQRCRVVVLTGRSARVFSGQLSDYGGSRIEPTRLDGGAGRVFADGHVPRCAIVQASAAEPHRALHGRGAKGSGIHGGCGSRAEALDTETRRFMRGVAELVGDELVRARELPLVVIGLPRLIAWFSDGLPRSCGSVERIPINPQHLEAAELAHMVGERMRIRRQRLQGTLADRFLEARAHGLGSGDFAEVARAAVAGKVETLLLDEGRREPGTIDRRDGTVVFPEQAAAVGTGTPSRVCPEEDLFGALAEIVLERRGSVVPLPPGRMPTRTGVAGIHRWA
jgi:hypothetical protein